MPRVRRSTETGGWWGRRAPKLLIIAGLALISLAAYAVYVVTPIGGSLITFGDDPTEAKQGTLSLGSHPYVTCPGLSNTGWFAFGSTFTGGIYVASGDVDGNGCPEVIVGAGAGGGPHVKIFRGDGTLMSSFFAFNSAFRGGVRVAAGDVDGDGRDEIIVGAGPGGGPHVRVFDRSGSSAVAKSSFFAFASSFRGGVFVGSGDVRGSSRADIIVGAGQGGGPHVRLFDAAGSAIDGGGFFAFSPSFEGGVRVAAAQVDTGKAEIIVGAGPGGGPHLKVINSTTYAAKSQWFAFSRAFSGGIFVGGAEVVPGSARQEVIAGADSGGGPNVKVFNGGGGVLSSFFAYSSSFTGGVRVAGGDHDHDGNGEVLTGAGPGGGPHVKQFE